MKLAARQLTQLIREALASSARDKDELYARVAGALHRMERRLHKRFLKPGAWDVAAGGINLWLIDVPPPSLIDELVRMGFDSELVHTRHGDAIFVRHTIVDSSRGRS